MLSVYAFQAVTLLSNFQLILNYLQIIKSKLLSPAFKVIYCHVLYINFQVIPMRWLFSKCFVFNIFMIFPKDSFCLISYLLSVYTNHIYHSSNPTQEACQDPISSQWHQSVSPSIFFFYIFIHTVLLYSFGNLLHVM